MAETDPAIVAEQAVLGCMLLSPSAIDEVFSVVGPRDFWRPAHQIIAECIRAMHAAGKPAQAVTVASELASRGKIVKTGGAPYLHTLVESAAVPPSAGYFAGMVREYAGRRRVGEIAGQMAQAAEQGLSLSDIIARAHADLEAVSRGAGRVAAESSLIRGIPAYPVGRLWGPLADLVASTTLPAALVAGAGLGALAGLCGPADLVMPDESRVRPVLWVALVAPKSAGKSPAMDKAFGRLRDLDVQAHDRYRTELEQYASKRGAMPKPRDTTRRIDDATMEVLARFLQHGDGTGVVESDELSGFLQSIGQYKGTSGDKGRWLALWSSAPWRYQRVSGEKSGALGIDYYIARPVVSIVGGIQPHLQHLLGDADSGFRPRWLVHSAALESQAWQARPHVPGKWNAAIEKLHGAYGKREWQLTGEALRLWQEQCARWKAQARGSENASASAALDKSDIQCARIALVLAESDSPAEGGEIPAEAMRCAIAITDYVMDCWRAIPVQEAFALTKRDEILSRKVDELANWLETRADRKAPRSQVREAHVAGVRTTRDLDTLLQEYASVYPGTIVQEQPAGGGRPGQVIYAPVRGSLSAPGDPSPLTSRVSGRPETPLRGEETGPEVKPQVSGVEVVSGQVAGNLVAGNSVAGNSSVQNGQTPVCDVCREPIRPALVEAGITAHPLCERVTAGQSQ